LEAISTSSSTKDVTWIFTDASSSQTAASAIDYQQAAERRGSPFFSIILQCSLDENLRRAESTERGGSTNTKLRDVSIIRSIREKENLHQFNDEFELLLDITYISAVEAAELIFRHICKFS
jgi:hypothetical protein